MSIRQKFRYPPVGKLFITNTKIVFTPLTDIKSFASFEKAKIEKIKFDDGGIVTISNVSFKYNGDEAKFIVIWHEFAGNDNSSKAITNFLFRAINKFDETVKEFNQLTASMRQEDEEELKEEETEPDIFNKYDRFKDLTIVSTSKMLVKGNKRSIRTYAEYNFAGKTQKKPEKVSLYFYASAARPLFQEDDLELNFLVDDKRVSIGKMRLADEEKTKTAIKQTITISMPYETFEQIANGKKVEFQIGNLEYKLTDIHLDAFRKLLAHKVDE